MLYSHLGAVCLQKTAKNAEENADSIAEDATKKAGKAAHDATKKVHEKKDEVDLPSKVDQATERAVKETKEAPEKAGSAAGSASKKVPLLSWKRTADCPQPCSNCSCKLAVLIALLPPLWLFK